MSEIIVKNIVKSPEFEKYLSVRKLLKNLLGELLFNKVFLLL